MEAMRPGQARRPARRAGVWGLGLLLTGAVLVGGLAVRGLQAESPSDPLEQSLAPEQRMALAAARERITRALSQMDEAARAGRAEAMAQAQRAVNEALGIGMRATLAPRQIEAALPASLGGLPRQASDIFADDTLGARSVSVSTRYGSDASRRIALSVSDTGGLSAWAVLADWQRAARTAAQAGRSETVQFAQGRVRREVAQAAATPAQISLVLANGVAVEALADGLDLDGLRAALEDLDLAALEGLQP